MDYHEIGKIWRDEEAQYPFFYFRNPSDYTVYGMDFAKKEETMKEELEFEDHGIFITDLVEKSACADGIVWYVRKYMDKKSDGCYAPTVEDVYNAVPRDDWKLWIYKNYSEYIRVKKPKYCCDRFAEVLHGGWIVKDGGHYNTQCRCLNNNPHGIFKLEMCPFCGKKLEE